MTNRYFVFCSSSWYIFKYIYCRVIQRTSVKNTYRYLVYVWYMCT